MFCCSPSPLPSQGKVAERGSHQALVAMPGGLYADLWNTQNSKLLGGGGGAGGGEELPAERINPKEEERKKLQEEIVNSVKGCGNCTC